MSITRPWEIGDVCQNLTAIYTPFYVSVICTRFNRNIPTSTTHASPFLEYGHCSAFRARV